MPYKDLAVKRSYQREWCRKKRARALEGQACGWCGATNELEFHHRDPSTKLNHRIWSWSSKRIEHELRKCIVLCRPCHDKGHAQAQRIEAELRHPHGTQQRYWLGCHCDLCRTANREYERDRRLALLSEPAA